MPALPQDLLDRLAKIERRLRAVEGRAHIRPALDQVLNGDVIIGEGGQLMVFSPANPSAAIFAIGRWFSGEGGFVYGAAMRREDGSLAFDLSGNNVGGGERPMVRMWARGETPLPIVADDAYADGYLGRPWVPIPMAPRYEFTAGSWETAFTGFWRVQHAVLEAHYSVWAPASTTAQARLVINEGGGNLRQLGDTVSASNGNEVFTSQRIGVGEHGKPWGEARELMLQVQRTSGSGTCAAFMWGLWGTNTFNAGEAG